MVETARSSQIGVYHSRNEPYDQWIESIGIPIHRGYAFDDMREIEVAPWDERGCNGAFLVLAGLNMSAFHVFVGRELEGRGARIAGAVSLLLWICVVAFGRWTGFTLHATPLVS